MANDVVDYTEAGENNHFNGVPSMYGRLVLEQNNAQPKYCWPGDVGGDMAGDRRNEQAGP